MVAGCVCTNFITGDCKEIRIGTVCFLKKNSYDFVDASQLLHYLFLGSGESFYIHM